MVWWSNTRNIHTCNKHAHVQIVRRRFTKLFLRSWPYLCSNFNLSYCAKTAGSSIIQFHSENGDGNSTVSIHSGNIIPLLLPFQRKRFIHPHSNGNTMGPVEISASFSPLLQSSPRTATFRRHRHHLTCQKLEFHGSSLLVASSWHPRRHARHPREDVTRMLRGCYEKTASVEFKLNRAIRRLILLRAYKLIIIQITTHTHTHTRT